LDFFVLVKSQFVEKERSVPFHLTRKWSWVKNKSASEPILTVYSLVFN